MKKNLFEKLGLVQVEDDMEFNEEVNKEDIQVTESNLAETPDLLGEPLIDDEMLYSQNNLITPQDIYAMYKIAGENSSIFKVDEICKKLPETLSDELKKQSVMGILEVTNLDKSALLSDAECRKEALDNVLSQFSKESNEVISRNESEIVDMLKRIEVLKLESENRKKLQESQEVLINQELSRINKIVEFIGQQKL